MDANHCFYENEKIAQFYSRESGLQPPEQTILRLLTPRLEAAAMLDIGVDGGRTTVHFAPKVRRYVGVDYSEAMLRRCRERFRGHPPSISFVQADAAAMEMFQDGGFDMALFSFNGIDCVTHEHRLDILREVRRVCRPGGYFAFSSHNLQYLHGYFDGPSEPSDGSPVVSRFVSRWRWRLLHNRHITRLSLQSAAYEVVREGGWRRTTPIYYIRPKEQVEQLSALFGDIKVYSLRTGVQVSGACELDSITDAWLYYLCQAT